MLRLLARLLHENDAPESQYVRLGIPADAEPGEEHLLVAAQAALASAAAQPLPPLGDFPAGRFGLGTPLPELLSHPLALEVLRGAVPQLVHTETLGMLGSTSLYQLAAMIALPPALLRGVAEDLSAL